jgi:hypothetical protein
LSVEIYRQFRRVRKRQRFDGRFMPYNWGGLPDPLSALWMPYSLMFQEFSRELANEINGFTNHVNDIRAWASVVEPLTDLQKMKLGREFIDSLGVHVLSSPYAIRSRYIFATAHLCHQANRTRDQDWSDDLPMDEDIYMAEADS